MDLSRYVPIVITLFGMLLIITIIFSPDITRELVDIKVEGVEIPSTFHCYKDTKEGSLRRIVCEPIIK